MVVMEAFAGIGARIFMDARIDIEINDFIGDFIGIFAMVGILGRLEVETMVWMDAGAAGLDCLFYRRLNDCCRLREGYRNDAG